MAAVVVLKQFGADVSGPFGRLVEDYGEPPRYEWRVSAIGAIGDDYESAERDEASDYIDSHFDREALDRAINDGYRRDDSRYDY